MAFICHMTIYYPHTNHQYFSGFCQTNKLNDAFQIAEESLKNGGKIGQKIFRFFTSNLSVAGEVDKLIAIGNLIDMVRTI